MPATEIVMPGSGTAAPGSELVTPRCVTDSPGAMMEVPGPETVPPVSVTPERVYLHVRRRSRPL